MTIFQVFAIHLATHVSSLGKNQGQNPCSISQSSGYHLGCPVIIFCSQLRYKELCQLEQEASTYTNFKFKIQIFIQDRWMKQAVRLNYFSVSEEIANIWSKQQQLS